MIINSYWLKLAMLVLLTSSAAIVAQDTKPDFDDTNPRDVLALLGQDRFLNDLEIVKDQREEIQKIRTRLTAEISELLTPPRKPSFMLTIDKTYKAAFTEIVDGILLPHQRTRFTQLLNQKLLVDNCQSSYVRFLLQKVDKKLNLTVNQKESLSSLQDETSHSLKEEIEKFQANIAKILANERADSFKILDAEQSSMLKTMLGDRIWGMGEGEESSWILEQFIKEKKKTPTELKPDK